MALQPLDIRLDKLNQELADIESRIDAVSLPKVDPDIDATVPTITPDALDPGVQVAGLGSGLTEMLVKKISKVDIRKPPTPPVTPDAVAAAAVEDTTKAAIATGTTTSKTEAKIAAKVEAAKQPSLTPDAFISQRKDIEDLRQTVDPALEKPPELAFNLPLMATTEDVKSTIETINQAVGIKTKNITFDDVKALAEGAGIGPKFIDDLTSGKLEVSPENTYKALNAMVASAKNLDALAAKVADGTATPTELAQMAQTIHFHSVLQQSVKGYQTNVAQSLAVMRMPREGAVDIAAIMENFGNETDIVKFAQAYLDVKTPEGKANLIREMAQGSPWEKLFTVYVNGLLARPSTHVKNFLSNTIFLPWRMFERAGAATLGELRAGIGLSGDTSYELIEVPAMLASTGTAVRNGWQLMSHAFANGVPKGWTDPVKIARQQARMDLLNYRNGSMLSWMPRSINFIATLPGRSLMSADEFFKGINYTYELTAETARLGVQTYDDALKAGLSAADAAKARDAAIDQFLLEPPDYVANLAEVGTFTQKLEGVASKLAASLNPNTATGFALRTQMPFISTPINIMGEVVSRTPLAPFTKSYWAAMKAGGKEADMANVKLGLGAAAIYGFSEMATSGLITGSGPGDKGTRQAMERQGWQPYSFVIDISNVKEDIRDIFSQFPGTRFGSGDYAGKVFVSYQGLEPIGALMGMSADYVDYARYEQDDSRINAYAGGLVFGMANYMLEHPFLTGVSNIATLMGGNVPNTREHLVNIMNGIAKMGSYTMAKSVEPLSGAVTSVKEKIDPYRRDYQADPNLPAGIKGLMDGLNKWKAETPGLSEGLPPLLNIWGEPIEHEFAWSPIRIKEGKHRPVDQALIQLNANVSMPSRTVSKKDPSTGISTQTKLTTQEYNEMLRIANYEMNLESEVMAAVDVVKQDKNPDNLIFHQNVIKKVFGDVFEAARKKLTEESIYSSDINKRIADKAQRLKQFGQGAK
jgi:hypothetical protein